MFHLRSRPPWKVLHGSRWTMGNQTAPVYWPSLRYQQRDAVRCYTVGQCASTLAESAELHSRRTPNAESKCRGGTHQNVCRASGKRLNSPTPVKQHSAGRVAPPIVGKCSTCPRGRTESLDWVRRFRTCPGQSPGSVRKVVRNPVPDRGHVQRGLEHAATNGAVASGILRDVLTWANEMFRILVSC